MIFFVSNLQLIKSDGCLQSDQDRLVSQATRLHHKNREMREVCTAAVRFSHQPWVSSNSQVDDQLNHMKVEYAGRVKTVKKGETRFLQKVQRVEFAE
jgi:hypothetical protein